MNLKSVFSAVVTEVKRAEGDVKDFVDKALPVAKQIATDVTDIVKGVTPPSTGNKDLDVVLKVLTLLAPYYAGNEAGLVSEINDIVSFLEGASAAL